MGANKFVLAACLMAMGSALPPTATGNPVIVSTAVVGIAMAAVKPATTGTVTGWTYQWNKAGTPISGATSAVYSAVTGDAQATTLTISMTPYNGGTPGNTVTSAAVVVAPASAAFATALAAVTDGQYFTAPSAANGGARLRVYQRQSGKGVLMDVTPASSTVNVAAALVRALPLPTATPVVDFDSSDSFYGEREFQNRAPGAGTRTLNLLGQFAHAKMGYRFQGTPTVLPRVSDSVGGTLATQIQIASGAAASTDFYIPVRIPPGTWTLAFDGKAITTGLGAATQSIKFGYNTTTTLTTAALTTSWQTFTQTFDNATEGSYLVLWVHGDFPSAASVNYDFAIANLRLTPGTAAQIPAFVDTDAHPSIHTQTDIAYNGIELESLTQGAADGNMLTAKLAALTATTGFTFRATLNGIIGSAAQNPLLGSLVKNDMTGTAYVYQANAAYSGPPAQAQTFSKTNSLPLRDANWGGMGRVNYTFVFHQNVLSGNRAPGVQTGIDVYANGLFITNTDLGVGAQTNTAGVTFNGLGNSGSGLVNTQFSQMGDVSTLGFWASDLNGSQVANDHVVCAARAAAKGLTLAALSTLVIACGDSITYGLQDAPLYGFVNRAMNTITNGAGNVVPVGMQAVVGAQLTGTTNSQTNSVQTAMNATVAGNGYNGILAQVAACVAAGVRPVVSLLIGANDAPNLTSQASVEAYYNANFNSTGFSLKQCWAALRTAGAKVMPCTVIPDGFTNAWVFESGAGATSPSNGTGTGTIAATSVSTAAGLAGNTYLGWRAYLNALIRSDTSLYDALCDLAAESHFAGQYATCNGGVPTGIYQDTLHPNPLGNAYLAVPYKAAVSTLIV